MRNKDQVLKINSFLSFRIKDETYAINAGKILHILEMVKITKIPKAPEYMKGVINLRGTVLPIIDMRTKLELDTENLSLNACILVLELRVKNKKLQLGAIIDEVKEVLELQEENIKPSPSIGSKYSADFIEGVAIVNEDFVMILDIEKILSSKEFDSLKKISTTQVGKNLESVK